MKPAIIKLGKTVLFHVFILKQNYIYNQKLYRFCSVILMTEKVKIIYKLIL